MSSNHRSLTNRAIKGCVGCKKFQATAFQRAPPGNLPNDRTPGSVPFQVVAVDYAGPISYNASESSFVEPIKELDKLW